MTELFFKLTVGNHFLLTVNTQRDVTVISMFLNWFDWYSLSLFAQSLESVWPCSVYFTHILSVQERIKGLNCTWVGSSVRVWVCVLSMNCLLLWQMVVRLSVSEHHIPSPSHFSCGHSFTLSLSFWPVFHSSVSLSLAIVASQRKSLKFSLSSDLQ